MGKITILKETPKNPITLMGNRAGICYGSDVSDDEKNYKRGMDCIESNHGRVLEFVDVHMVIEGYSARVMREYTRHIGGSTPWLQSSTRYIDYSNFDYIIPDTINKNEAARMEYWKEMKFIQDVCGKLIGMGIPKEDVANILPLGMKTCTVEKRNLRNLIDMSHTRLCSRAYWEFRELLRDIMEALSQYSDEWKTVVEMCFKPKCDLYGYCTESKSCGRKAKKDKK